MFSVTARFWPFSRLDRFAHPSLFFKGVLRGALFSTLPF